jgi:hypothetical protein
MHVDSQNIYMYMNALFGFSIGCEKNKCIQWTTAVGISSFLITIGRLSYLSKKYFIEEDFK